MAKRTAIVTGSSRGIGESIVRRLAAEGYAVCVNDIPANQAGIDKVVDDLNKTHGSGSAIGVAADVTSSSQVRSMVKESVEKLGPLTVMVANAGIAQLSPALDISDEDFKKMFDVNVNGVWYCYTEAARQMISQGPVPEGSSGYRIIGAASVVALKPSPLLAHYSASKWAVRGLTQVFAMEMAKHKINVNAYAPGIVGTPMWDALDEKLGEMEGRAKGESVMKLANDMTALGRLSVPQDVGNVVGGFMCSKDSDFVTGQTMVIDGGIVFT